MKEGWKYKKLGEVCDKVSNLKWQNVPSNSVYSYVDLTAVDRDSFNITNTQSINRENAPSRAKQIIKQNDVLFGTTRPTLRRVCVVEDKNDGDICSTGFCVLRPKSEIVSSKWVFYQLMAEKYYAYIEPLQSGATYPAVTDAVVKSYIIPIPPISEQQHIVEELDLLSSIIEKKKAQLNELDNLAQSLFYEMFGDPITNDKGWEVRKLNDIYKLKSGDGLSAKNFVEGIYPVYGGNGISGYHNAYNMNGDFIIIGRVGAYCGNVRYVKGLFWLTDNAFQLFFDANIQTPVFVLYLLTLLDLHRFANEAAQPVISNKTLRDLDIIIPTMEMQKQFASKIEAVEHQKELIQKSIKEVETLFNSRMDYYFN